MKKQYQDKKILIMAGKPIGSVDIVSYLKSQGAYTIVTDNLSVNDSPAKQMADEHCDISTAEVDSIVKYAQENDISAVFTGVHEFNIWKTLEVCETLNFPFYATRSQLLSTSVKTEYKELFRKFGIPVVPEYSIEDGFSGIQALDFPVLVKPIDGSGGYGISICNNREELQKAYNHALKFSTSKKAMVEKHITSTEATIFYILQDGKIMLSTMADRYVAFGNESTIPLPVLYTFPSMYMPQYIETLNQKVINAFTSLGLKNGMIFIQAFANEKGFMLYDIGFRLTGTQEYHILEELCGYNPLHMMTDYAITGRMGKQDIVALVDPYLGEKRAFNITFLVKPCVVGEFVGLEKLHAIPGVLKVIKNHKEGAVIPESALGTLNLVVLRVLGVAENKEQMQQTIKTITKTVDVLSVHGKSVLLPLVDIDGL